MPISHVLTGGRSGAGSAGGVDRHRDRDSVYACYGDVVDGVDGADTSNAHRPFILLVREFICCNYGVTTTYKLYGRGQQAGVRLGGAFQSSAQLYTRQITNCPLFAPR